MSESSQDAALEMGHRTQRAMQLMANHCRHGRVDLFDGTSMLGSMIGLPIGLVQAHCDHAPAAQQMAMDGLRLAVDFYRANCVGCQFHSPTGLLPSLATESRALQQREDADAAARAAALRERVVSWEARRARRRRAVVLEGYPARDIAANLDLIDLHPADEPHHGVAAREHAARGLLETARRAPQLFNRALVDVIHADALATADPTAVSLLRVLAHSGTADPPRVAQLAAHILAEQPSPQAGQVVAELVGELADTDLAAAIDNIVTLAAVREWSPLHESPGEPAALIAVSSVNLPLVTDAVISALESSDNRNRGDAAQAARVLLEIDPKRIVALGPALIASITGPDEGYAGEPHPAHDACAAIAAGFRGDPLLTRTIIEAAARSLGGEIRAVVFGFVHDVHVPRAATAADSVATELVNFMAARCAADWGPEVAFDAGRELTRVAKDSPAVVYPHHRAILNVLLGLCTVAPPSPLIDPTMSPPASQGGTETELLAALQRFNESNTRYHRRDDLAAVLGSVARYRPTELVPDVIDLLHATSGDAAQGTTLRSMLIATLESTVTSATVNTILPELYTALLRPEPSVQATAIDLWTACAAAVTALPDDLGALAETLLADTHVVVHQAMLRNIASLGLPDHVAVGLWQSAVRWTLTYAGKDERVMDDALHAVLWTGGRGSAALQAAAAVFVLSQVEHARAYDRERLLLYSLKSEIGTPAWSRAALGVLADPSYIDHFNQRDHRLVQALMNKPDGMRNLDVSDFRAVADAHLPEFVAEAAVPVALLQAADRYADAAAFASQITDSVPDTTEYAGRRQYLEQIHAYAEAEADAERDHPVSGAGPSSPPDPARALPFQIHAAARSLVRAALATLPAPSPDESATILDTAAAALHGPGDASSRATIYRDLLPIGAHLLRYDAATRRADPAADTHRAAAHRGAQVLAAPTEHDPVVADWLTDVASASASTVDALLGRLRRLPAPLPLVEIDLSRPKVGVTVDEPELPPTAVCVLLIDGQPITDIVTVEKGRAHDLTVEVRLPDWPEWATRCDVTLLTTLPGDVLTVPALSYTRLDAVVDEIGIRLSQSGTLFCSADRRPASPPFDLPLLVRFTGPEHPEALADVAGYTRLRMRSWDPALDQRTHHRQMDARLDEIYDRVLDDHTLDQTDVAAFIRLFTACVRDGQSIMFDQTFRAGKTVTETQFHDELEARLRADVTLEGRLTRRDAVGGGFDDLLHDDIIAELKVEKTTPRTLDNCARFVGQPTQYGVGRGSRLSILVLLDHSPKKSPAGQFNNYVGLLSPQLHGLAGPPPYPSLVGVIIINTHWRLPSNWARRAIDLLPRAGGNDADAGTGNRNGSDDQPPAHR
jgi:hypothetical protein